MRQEVLQGPERRRRWSVEEKQRIVAEVDRDGLRVADVARRYDVLRQQIYRWRQELRQRSDETAVFVPVSMASAGDDGEGNACSGRQASTVEIALANGRRLSVPSTLSSAVLRQLIRTVEAA